jgi:hypothetical protein
MNNNEGLEKSNKGFFYNKNGTPDFWGLGPIFKLFFTIFVLFIIISKNISIASYMLFIGAIGKFLNAVRFYYINTLVKNGNDEFFIDMNVIENAVESFLLFFVGLYIASYSWVKKL